MRETPQFTWDESVREAMRLHVETAVRRIDPSRYAQEPAYLSALIARLDGVVYDGSDARVEIVGTIVADRGRRSAESRFGADFALTAALMQGSRRAKKAVLGQAKRGPVGRLPPYQTERLTEQCDRMLRSTEDCVVLEVPIAFDDQVLVRVLDRQRDLPHALNSTSDVYSLDRYLMDALMSCRHGDMRGEFVQSVQRSVLTGLHVIASTEGGWPA